MMQKNRTGIIVQARMGSSRLPGKMGSIFFDDKSLLEVVLEKLVKNVDNVSLIVATTTHERDDFIEKVSLEQGFDVFRGSEDNVLERFVCAAEMYSLNWVVRICADNPFIQPKYIQKLIDYAKKCDADYVGYRLNSDQPAIKSHLGLFPELISFKALKELNASEPPPIFKEHVTNYFYSNENTDYVIEWIDIKYDGLDIDKIRLTIDTKDDLEVAMEIYRHFKRNGLLFHDTEIFEYLVSRPSLIRKMSKNILQNEK